MDNHVISYRDVCDILMNKNSSLEQALPALIPGVEGEPLFTIISEIKKRFVGHFNKRFKEVSYNKDVFLRKHSKWLENNFIVPFMPMGCETDLEPGSRNVGGRPTKDFSECSRKSQLRKISGLQASVSQDLINAAASKSEGKEPTILNADSALALITQAKLSKYQYELIRKTLKDLGHKIFPSYKKVLQSKRKCYPENVTISETSAQVPLQDLLDHVSHRIFESKDEMEIESWVGDNVILHSKWGFDGCSGQRHYMQNFSSTSQDQQDPDLVTTPQIVPSTASSLDVLSVDEQEPEVDIMCDSSMFMTSLVPLQISAPDNKHMHLWKNDRPNSTRYCRPLKFEFIKESRDVILAEKDRVDDEIRRLTDTTVTYGTRTFKVTHKLYFTMIDGKVGQIVTGTSSASNCIICGGKPSELNDLTRFGLTNEDALLEMGMSTLHARIKFMEYVLHLSYNVDFEAWRTSKTTRPQREAREKLVKRQLREKLGISVDMVKQGAGTTNTGNTSRRFFEDPSVTAEITLVDEELIRRLKTILNVICSQSHIDHEKFREYARDTANLAVTKYHWYYLPASLHKILFHGAEMIQRAVFPMGTLSEEAQECRNKDYRMYREHHSRKVSRKATNEDVFNFMLVSSDPYISHLRPNLDKKKIPLDVDATALILED